MSIVGMGQRGQSKGGRGRGRGVVVVTQTGVQCAAAEGREGGREVWCGGVPVARNVWRGIMQTHQPLPLPPPPLLLLLLADCPSSTPLPASSSSSFPAATAAASPFAAAASCPLPLHPLAAYLCHHTNTKSSPIKSNLHDNMSGGRASRAPQKIRTYKAAADQIPAQDARCRRCCLPHHISPSARLGPLGAGDGFPLALTFHQRPVHLHGALAWMMWPPEGPHRAAGHPIPSLSLPPSHPAATLDQRPPLPTLPPSLPPPAPGLYEREVAYDRSLMLYKLLYKSPVRGGGGGGEGGPSCCPGTHTSFSSFPLSLSISPHP